MSALGHKRTKRHLGSMSALPPKADIERRDGHVRFVPKAHICTAANNAPFDYVVGAGVNDPPPARSKAVIRPSLTPSLPADH